MSENDLQSFAPVVGRMKSKRWVQASAPSYDGDDWDDDYYSGDDAPEVPEVPSEHVASIAEVDEGVEEAPEAPPVIKPLALGRAGQQQKLEEQREQERLRKQQEAEAEAEAERQAETERQAELEKQYQAKLAEEKRQREQLEELEREQQRIREARARAEAETKARDEAEAKAREEAEAKARAEAEEQDRLEREEIEREYRERQDAERQRQKQEEAERLEREEEERLRREEEERQAKMEEERQAKLEAERQAKLEEERLARLEAERQAKLEADRQAKLEAEKARKVKIEKARIEAEKQAAREAEERRLKEEQQRLAEEEEKRQAEAEAARVAALEAELEAEREKESKRQEVVRQAEKERLDAEREAEYQSKLEARAKEAEKARQAEEEQREAEQARLEAERHALLMSAAGEEGGDKTNSPTTQSFYDSRSKGVGNASGTPVMSPRVDYDDFQATASPNTRDPYDPSNHWGGGAVTSDSAGRDDGGSNNGVVGAIGGAIAGAAAAVGAATLESNNDSEKDGNKEADKSIDSSTGSEAHTVGLSKEVLAAPSEADASNSLKHASMVAQVGADESETPTTLPSSSGTATSKSMSRVDSVEDIVADYYAYSSDEGVEGEGVEYDEEGVEEGSTMDGHKDKEEEKADKKDAVIKDSLDISPVSSTSHSHYADAEDVEAGYTMDGVKMEGSDGSDNETDHETDEDDKKLSKLDTSGASAVPDTSDVSTPKLGQEPSSASTDIAGKREIPSHLVPGLAVGTGGSPHVKSTSEITPTTEMNKLSDEILNSFSAEGNDPYYTNSAYDYDDSDAGPDAELQALYAGSHKFLDARMSRDMSDVHGDFSVAPLSPKRLSRVAVVDESNSSPSVGKVAAVVGAAGAVGVASGVVTSGGETTSASATPTTSDAPKFEDATKAVKDAMEGNKDLESDLQAKQTEPLPSLPSIPVSSLDPGTPTIPSSEDKREKEGKEDKDTKEKDDNDNRASSPELDEFEDAVERISTNDEKPDRTSHDSGYKSMILATSLENVATTPSAGASSRSASRGAGILGKQSSISSMNALGKTDSSSSSGVPPTASSAVQNIFPTNSVSTGSPAQAPASFAKQATTTAVLPKGPAITTAQVRSGPSYDFRSILTRPRSIDRANAFNDARKREAEYSPGLESWLVFTYNALKTDAGISDMQTSGSYSGGSNNLPKASSNLLAGSIGDVFQNPLSGMSGATKVSEKSSQVFNKVGESTTKRARGLFAKSKKLMKGDR
ncbi:hypothetical protein BKA91DRAFT_44844 [Yarrowia lipolytica]|nr:hypothetical protein BKA91DRAFT_44844 [Yarrowia lipolytica]KAE8168935.1 hypothetical protein BKA90DRAFT_7007 [Yarrowia lipolytica]RMI94307.1 hypothetical protein BD777DRAFT_155624 [Yarrowia lipolytica]